MFRRRRVENGAGAIRGLGQFRELRDVVVPFDQRRNLTQAPRRALIERPYFVADRMIVGIEQVCTMVAMPGEMILHDALGRHRVKILIGVEAMIERAHKDLLMSSRIPQSASAAMAEMNSHSLMVESANAM